jgi:hypothetical protein
MEELVRFAVLLRPHVTQLVDRYSEREESGVPIDRTIDLSSIAKRIDNPARVRSPNGRFLDRCFPSPQMLQNHALSTS